MLARIPPAPFRMYHETSSELRKRNRPSFGVDPMWDWADELYPVMRSLAGPGTVWTLDWLAQKLPNLEVREVPSGEHVLDWKVPNEWELESATLVDARTGECLLDTRDHTLSVVSHSTAFEGEIDAETLHQHVHVATDLPDAVPYVTSYYAERWGLCAPASRVRSWEGNRFQASIRAKHVPGMLRWGECTIPGEQPEEVLISTYICHPSMANNELSGPVVATALARHLSLKRKRYTYRILFVPETIGAIAFISQQLDHLRERVVAGFIMTCCGDGRGWSAMPSRLGDTGVDRAVRRVANRRSGGHFEQCSYLLRGSDERQYCSPLVDLPVASLMRSRYATYPEYHTSADDLELITQNALEETLSAHIELIDEIESADDLLTANQNPSRDLVAGRWIASIPCEPQLGKRGLYRDLSTKDLDIDGIDLTHVLSYCDGTQDIESMKSYTKFSDEKIRRLIDILYEHTLIRRT